MKLNLLGERIVVVGANGSGKTTFAKKLAEKLKKPFYELDEIYWQENWKGLPDDEFRNEVNEVTLRDRWIIDGNYAHSHDLTLGRCETVVWLDYSFPKILYRVTKRTFLRLMDRKPLWKNNRESLKMAFSPRYSIILYAIRTYKRKKEKLEKFMNTEKGKDILWIRIKNCRDETLFLESL
jgi:adenylate kinase family enzyme